MKSRRKAREAAVQALFQCDTLVEWTEGSLLRFMDAFYPESHTTTLEELTESEGDGKKRDSDVEHREFALRLMRGVIAEIESIDRQISGASNHWSLTRMARVDRNILRLATFELMFLPEVPANVIINEAIEIAKGFGTDESPMFVNGVLDHISKGLASRRAPPTAANE